MGVRVVGDGRRVQRPAFEPERLVEREFGFSGGFEDDLVLVSGGSFAGAEGEGSLSRSAVRGADLSGSRLSRLELADVRFEDVELSSASWQHVSARRVELVRSRAMGLRLSLAAASDVYVEGCRLDYAAIHVEHVKGALVFHDCPLREATITGDLSKVVFSECVLDGAEFAARSAAGCDLTTSRLGEARGLLTLRGARITAEQAISAATRLATESGLVIRP